MALSQPGHGQCPLVGAPVAETRARPRPADFPQHANGVFRTEAEVKPAQKFTEAASCSRVPLAGRRRRVCLTLSPGGARRSEAPGDGEEAPRVQGPVGGRVGLASPSLLQCLPGPVPRARGRQVPGKYSFDELADEM